MAEPLDYRTPPARAREPLWIVWLVVVVWVLGIIGLYIWLEVVPLFYRP